MLRSIASAIADSNLNQWISDTWWLWPVLEISHFIGLSIMLGALLIVDLRILGLLRVLEADSVNRLTPAIWFGFCVNLLTGALFFIGDPTRYAINIGFRLKMLLILFAGFNVLIYHLQVRPSMTGWGGYTPTSAPIRLVALTSLLTWTAILLLGRLIPYVGSG